MTERAVRLIIARITRDFGERFVKTVNGKPVATPAEVLADWMEDLADLDDDMGFAAVAEVRKTLPHPPVPADIMNAARALGWQEPDKYTKALAILACKDLAPADKYRRVRALWPQSGKYTHFGFPDDPPYPWEIPGNEEELAKWDGAAERAAGLLAVTQERAEQLAEAERARETYKITAEAVTA